MNNTEYRSALQNFFIHLARKRNWIYGERVLEKFAKQDNIQLTWIEEARQNENVNCFDCIYTGLGFNATSWHGTKVGARSRAAVD